MCIFYKWILQQGQSMLVFSFTSSEETHMQILLFIQGISHICGFNKLNIGFEVFI
jgi:hypothetical protein